MTTCPACEAEVQPGSRFCFSCGSELPPDPAAPTELAPEELSPRPATPPPDPSSPSSSRTLGGARFAPGTILAGGRYRIVGLLGKGGMGEVYRAEDLLLDQPVALKFLPEELVEDPDRLRRLLTEVRLSRQVAHPNVCRVYDIGEVEEHRFFSMELVEGEDLASLLKQVGRISGEKGVEIARQLCAGLAAAHDRGVVHRDLKPANVMIDRSGRLRITDFGLALAEGIEGPDAAAGTPAYMAPEQLAGREATERSDLWSLGVVLYELFTGERPFQARSLPELRRELDESHVSSPSSHVEDLDPAVERIILRCLERDPRHRPPSAAAVAAALPGGDPLAAALAAGETPSPELVAAAGGEGSLDPVRSLALAAGGLVLVLAAAFAGSHTHTAAFYPLERPPEVLEEASRSLLRELGHDAPVADTASGWFPTTDVVRYLSRELDDPDRWQILATGRTPGLFYLYRQSPRYLQGSHGFTVVWPDDPPLRVSGEARIRLDPLGRLLELDIVPPQLEAGEAAPGEPPATDWTPLFAAAGVEATDFTAVSPLWRPPYDVDERRAWTGEYPELPGVPIRLEAAAVDGRPVHFRALGPWSRPERMEQAELTRQEKVLRWVYNSFTAVVLVGALFLAWRNLRLGRGDRRGAFRLAFWFFVVHSFCWLVWAHHTAELPVEWAMIERDLGYNLFLAATVWVLYIALEPYVRRHWPETLIGWSRLVSGRLRDPRLGRDVLVGVAAGGVINLLFRHDWFLSLVTTTSPAPGGTFSSVSFVGRVLDAGVHELFGAMMVLFLLVASLVILRHRWLAVTAVGAFFVTVFTLASESPLLSLPFLLLVLGVALTVATRHGLVALFVTLFVNRVLRETPFTTDIGAWYAWKTWLVLAVIAALLVYGYRTTTAGRPLVAGRLLEV